uniref:Uncharacterized protein n=1 Tax=Tanacetum cinerariifolium TaxID=118510 RepID=A0A699H5K8_TANCI|nr:hypothetical protein [Tanacetum cinerariifolium]
MANLTFADSHNMVVYLEKSTENTNFAEIVTFFNANHIRYALTDARALEINKLKKRVKKLESRKKSRTPQLKMRLFKVRVESSSDKNLETQGRHGQDTKVNTASAPVTTADVSVSTAEPSTPPTTTTLIEDEDLIIAQTLMKMRNTRLQEEERGELTIKEKSRLFVESMDKRKKYFARLRAEKIKSKPTTKTQKRNQMCTYLKNIENYKHNQLKNKSFKEIQMLFNNTMKWIESFVPMDSEVVEGSSQVEGSKKRTRKELDEASVKRQKLEDDAEKAKLKLCLEIVLNDDEAINIEYLSTKYPIVDWNTHILDENKMYYQIIRADGSTKYYKIFSAMLDDFNRQDGLDLYRLVKERLETTSLEGYDRLLWGDLITLFEPS